jgi:glycogen debranching enzyme
MDARTSRGPVTPRHGTPVELAALWCSLLAHLEELSRSKLARRARSEQRKRARRAFLERFWIEETGYLADVWREGTRDTAVRPNAVLAASLELAPLTKAQRARVVERAEAMLLTPRGLRTLAPDERGYRGRFRGGPEERDGAYHQGTVWPWLLGAYTEASLRAGRPTRARLAALTALWEGLEPELDRAGLDHLSEVFDGDPPHAPGGTFAQAWNTAEWLRARQMLADGHA